MRRRPPRSTRTDTLFPYTTLFRSIGPPPVVERAPSELLDQQIAQHHVHRLAVFRHGLSEFKEGDGNAVQRLHLLILQIVFGDLRILFRRQAALLLAGPAGKPRSEVRRVGKACVSTCSARWAA